MKISEVMQRLQAIQNQYGDLPVMFEALDSGVWELFVVKREVAEADQYPEDWEMPEGFEFVKLTQ
jgi:hypothetical protein